MVRSAATPRVSNHEAAGQAAISSTARGLAAHLFAGPAVFGDRLARIERSRAGIGDVSVVEREVQQEQPVDVGAPEVEAGADHADLVADAHAAAPRETVRAGAVAVDLVRVAVVDDHGFAPAVDQALSAIELCRKQQPNF